MKTSAKKSSGQFTSPFEVVSPEALFVVSVDEEHLRQARVLAGYALPRQCLPDEAGDLLAQNWEVQSTYYGL